MQALNRSVGRLLEGLFGPSYVVRDTSADLSRLLTQPGVEVTAQKEYVELIFSPDCTGRTLAVTVAQAARFMGGARSEYAGYDDSGALIVKLFRK